MADCGVPKQPVMSLVTVSDGLASYSCEEGYAVRGKSTRECRGAVWRGRVPSCESNVIFFLKNFIMNIIISQLLNALTQTPQQMVS